MATRGVALLVLLGGIVLGAACWGQAQKDSTTPGVSVTAGDEKPPVAVPQGLFQGWPEPEVVLLLTAQQHGYILPCGCSFPQYGGLERRYNFIQQLRQDRHWTVIPFDLGDIPQMKGPASLPNVQGLVKYRYTMKALKAMGYKAVSFGEYEAAQPLNDAMDEYALNEKEPPVLAANLINKAITFPDEKRPFKSYVGSWVTVPVKPDLKVGVVASISPSVGGSPTVIGKIKDPKLAFAAGNQVIPQALRDMRAAGVNFPVLLLQGSVDEATQCARALPQIQVILCLSEADLCRLSPRSSAKPSSLVSVTSARTLASSAFLRPTTLRNPSLSVISWFPSAATTRRRRTRKKAIRSWT